MVDLKPEDLVINGWDSKRRGGWSYAIPKGIEVVHLPTGIVVRCDKHRSQHKNREECLKMLCDKLEGVMYDW